MKWLDLSAYGVELKISAAALDKPALYVLTNGDFLETVLSGAGFIRRPSGLWLRFFEFGTLGPVLQTLVADLPLVRVNEMSPAEIGLVTASAVSREDLSGGPDLPSTDQDSGASRAEGIDTVFPDIPPASQAQWHDDSAENDLASDLPVVDVIPELSQPEASNVDPQVRTQRYGLLWKLPLLGLIGRLGHVDQTLRHEPQFAEPPLHRLDADWIVSVMREDAAALTGQRDLPAHCHLIAKLADAADIARANRLIGRRITMQSASGAVEVTLIGLTEGRTSLGFGQPDDVLVVGDPGEGFGASVIPDDLLLAEQAA
ncbi:hypothetical protein ACVIGB_000907 [Bradyrhizobium sp. USDA 4341]